MARKRRKSTRTSEEGSRMPGWNSRCVSERERGSSGCREGGEKNIVAESGLRRQHWSVADDEGDREGKLGDSREELHEERERERVSERVSEDTHTSRLPVCVAQDLRDSKRARKREQREQNENSCVDARQAESAGEREEQREGQQKGD